jgi:hypothetical protein
MSADEEIVYDFTIELLKNKRASDTTFSRAEQRFGKKGGPAFFAYSDNYLIDVKFGVIVDVEASRAIRQAEVGAARTMVERPKSALVSSRSGSWPIPPMGQLRC